MDTLCLWRRNYYIFSVVVVHGDDQFDRILVQKDDTEDYFRFFICFTQLWKEGYEAIEKFNKDMNFGEPILEAYNFTYDDIPKIYQRFHLFDTDISKFLEQLELEENANKYNL
jgi:hypothetical protein